MLTWLRAIPGCNQPVHFDDEPAWLSNVLLINECLACLQELSAVFATLLPLLLALGNLMRRPNGVLWMVGCVLVDLSVEGLKAGQAIRDVVISQTCFVGAVPRTI